MLAKNALAALAELVSTRQHYTQIVILSERNESKDLLIASIVTIEGAPGLDSETWEPQNMG